jgi:23S rRNA pseudouridine2605 synthase
MNDRQRLQQALARAGVASRRAAEALIRAGRVTVNGQVAVLGATVGPDDRVAVDGAPLPVQPPAVYLALNKPAGYTTSLRDPHAAHVVTELVPPRFGRVYPVGRLDRDTTGLILLTNDGELAYRLMHPRYRVPRVYQAWVKGVPGPTHLARLRKGVDLGDGTMRAAAVRVVKVAADASLVEITLTEGRKREVRRLFQAVGHPVRELKRVRFGTVTLGDLALGQVRPLTHREVRELRSLVEEPKGLTQTERSAVFAARKEDQTRRVPGTTARVDLERGGRVGAAGPRASFRDAGGHRRRAHR